MDKSIGDLLIEKKKKLSLKRFFEKLETISLVDFEEANSVWYKGFFSKLHEFNHIYSIPQYVKPCNLTEDEIIKWVLECLSDFNDETKFMLPVQDCLANIEVISFSDAIHELWRPYSNVGVSITMASKNKKKIFHVFEDEYEYQLYIRFLYKGIIIKHNENRANLH